MKTAIRLTAVFVFLTGILCAPAVHAYNFGDFSSETLTTKAWGALNEGDIEGVLAFTNKNLELYGEKAKEMQQNLDGYAEGDNQEIFQYWALNDVATSLFIQAEAYRKAGMIDEAKATYKKVINDYSYGQAWDPKGWFWRPAEAAEEKLAMLESGKEYDFGDNSSSYLTTQAWKALGEDDLEAVLVYTNKVIDTYGDKAKDMQESLTEYPWESNDEIFSYWALNDVGTSLFIKGEALRKSGEEEEAKEAYQKLINDFYYAQCWDPKGWFWKPADAAEAAVQDLGEI